VGFVKRNIDMICAVGGAPLLTAVFALLLKDSATCSGLTACSEYRTAVALFLGMVCAFVGSRIVYRAVHGVPPQG
jgi:hypothetical protein